MTGTYVSAATLLAAELALRKTLARALRATSCALARAARALLVQPRPVASMPAVYEFYAEAGAPRAHCMWMVCWLARSRRHTRL